jgi:4-amino-4-deoxy-L-arabinose transferase-like glycosyltransferase
MTSKAEGTSRFREFCSGNELLIVWLLALSAFMVGIWQQPFINFETRFAVFAQEMLRHGPSLFPTTYGQPYPDYPVASTLFIWLLSLPLGSVNKFSAVLPTAIASATVVLMTYRLFRLYSLEWAVLAVGFEFATVTFLAESRSISLDQMVSAVTVTAFYWVHAAYLRDAPVPIARIVPLLILGFLIRGPIGVVIPVAVVLSHLVWTHDWRSVLRFALSGAGVLVLCVAALAGLSYWFYGPDFVADVVRMQVVGRFSDASPASRSYYFVSSFGNYALGYPVALLALLALCAAKAWKWAGSAERSQLRLVAILASWVAVVLIGLSIPETKKARYILPIVPALAGIASFVFVAPPVRAMKWLRFGVQGLLIVIPVAATVLLVVARNKLANYGITPGVPIAVMAALSILGLALALYYRRRGAASVAVTVVAAGALLYAYIALVAPIDLALHDTTAFVRSVELLRDKRAGELVFYKENPDGLAIKYLVNARNTESHPKFVDEPKALEGIKLPYWILTRAKNLDELKARGIGAESVAYRGKFGDSEFVAVFVSTP